MNKQIQHAYICKDSFDLKEPYLIKFIGLPPFKPYEKDRFSNLYDAINSLQDKHYKMVAIKGESEYWFIKEE